MALQEKAAVQLVMLVVGLLLSSSATTTTGSTPPSKDDLKRLGCKDSCGGVSIPYPFGIENTNCYPKSKFEINCTDSNPYFGNMPLINISVVESEVRAMRRIARKCYNEFGTLKDDRKSTVITGTYFSDTKNKFTAIGCDTQATLTFFKINSTVSAATGCMTQCSKESYVVDGTCSGIGCCQIGIPKGLGSNQISLESYNNHSRVWAFNPCSYAFVAEQGQFNFSKSYLGNFSSERLPVVFDWVIDNTTCENAKTNPNRSYACGQNTDCLNRDTGAGYICNCSKGYEGNPYLSDGCKDIDECNSSIPCYGDCVNSAGNYTCSCRKGYEGDATKNGGCRRVESLLLTKIALGVSISISMLLFGSFSLYWGFRQRRIIKLRERFFQQNGGIMLQQKLSTGERSAQSTKIFTVEDLKKATNNYHESQVLGKGGHGTVYKGILPNNTVVAIKKSTVIDQSEIEQFINEVIVLSQVNHRNVVKIVGCCLETEVPSLVYEFVPNGTLYDHLHNTGKFTSVIPWETRLRIAVESAGALFYLHSVASTPIIHRDVKTANILLDQSYTAKVSDFGASRLVPVDQSQLTTLVQGTLGYLDPEYFQSSQLTEKSDVYSFGVVLLELITGKKALSFDSPEEERNLAKYFISSMEEDRLFEIVDKRMINEAMADQIKEVAILAKRCIKIKGDERPTMKEIAMELDGLLMMGKHPWVKDNKNSEETQHLLGELSDAYNVDGVSTSNSAAYDSLRNYAISPFDSGDGR